MAMVHQRLCKIVPLESHEVWEGRHERATIGCRGLQKGVDEGPVARRGQQHVLEALRGC